MTCDAADPVEECPVRSRSPQSASRRLAATYQRPSEDGPARWARLV